MAWWPGWNVDKQLFLTQFLLAFVLKCRSVKIRIPEPPTGRGLCWSRQRVFVEHLLWARSCGEGLDSQRRAGRWDSYAGGEMPTVTGVEKLDVPGLWRRGGGGEERVWRVRGRCLYIISCSSTRTVYKIIRTAGYRREFSL